MLIVSLTLGKNRCPMLTLGDGRISQFYKLNLRHNHINGRFASSEVALDRLQGPVSARGLDLLQNPV